MKEGKKERKSKEKQKLITKLNRKCGQQKIGGGGGINVW